MAITISILDQSPIYPGESAKEAFAHTVELVQKAEELGYNRYWVSEHHDTDSLAGSSPEVLIAYLLAKTKKIRIGSGGIMLQHYSPYKVAENFNVLSSLAPDRVDLGVGRAPGGLPRSTQALQKSITEPLSLTEKIIELKKHLHGKLGEDELLVGLQATPIPPVAPVLHVLGASVESAEITAELGLPYVFSLFISGDEQIAFNAVHKYNEKFISKNGSTPKVIVALTAIVAETDEEALELKSPQKLVKVHLASGRTITLGTIQQAEEYGIQANEPFTIEEREALVTLGSKETVRENLISLQGALGINEFMITTNVTPFEKRIRSFELLSEAFTEATVLQ
ncbi:LLM class flavin-dependent oxidoreductase [Paenibacillus endoradicis]|uniref:LLM class flavin-dependent oxidoreductase n=1 Tax=Paenibacillus endoradicis TaxID=2972487 RepID=UPI0021595059|nr:LLM class flavin-dependent oxidoreductase [Paenibacillus endoradicis]MCR8656201.1 LLM class flavin-dependent oxidoreductase [Paenibacillus endoradicis]